MPRYIRAHIPGGTFFFTVALLERRRRLLTEHVDVLRATFASVRAQRPFTIDAAVILPDHLHCIWTLPDGDTDFSGRWHAIKSRFSRSLPKEERLSARRIAKGERGIWQRRFWEHTIRDDEDFARHMDYIHYTLSNTATRGAFAIGRIRHSIDTFNTGYMRRIGVRATTCGRWIWSDVGRE